MRTKNNFILKIGKILLVFCTLFSQLSFSLEVFADEVVEAVSDEIIFEDNNLESENTNTDDESNVTLEENDVNPSEDNSVVDEPIDNPVAGEEDNPVAGEEDNPVAGEEDNPVAGEEDNPVAGEEDNPVAGEEDNPVVDEPIEKDVIAYIIDNGFIIINGTLIDNLTVSMLKEALINDGYGDSEITVSYQDVMLNDEDIVASGMSLVIDGTSYMTLVIGDIDGDGIVSDADIDALIEDLLDNTDDEEYILDIADVTYIANAIKNGKWNTEEVTFEDVLSFETSISKDNVLVGDTFEVSLIINEFDKNYINGIEGIVSYDKTVIQLESISVMEDAYVKGSKNEEGKFVYLLNDYSSEDEVLLTFTFKALSASDNVEIKIEDIIMAMDGYYAKVLDDTNYITNIVSIAPSGIGGDEPVEDDPTVEVPSEDDTTTDNNEQVSDSISVEDTTSGVVNTVNTVVTTPVVETVRESSDNYISSLEIDGYDIDFDINTYEYSITVGSDVDSLDLTIVLNDSSASYKVTGNEGFKEGSNTVDIVVTAEDGTERTYTINVDKEAEDVDDSEDVSEEEDSNVSRTVIIILIILVIIGLIYVIFKDDDEEDVKSDSSLKNNDNKKSKK